MKVALAAFAAAFALAGCGGSGGEEGEATLWVTRDRGARLLIEAKVDAGQTAMRALQSTADVETRYGGRFVQSIEGIGGSVTDRRDWFYYVNGLEMNRSAVEYRLHPGDILWWDYRSWAGRLRVPVVVGAFPEPFLHGFDGERRAAWVQARTRPLLRTARVLARIVRGRASLRPAPAGAIVIAVWPDPVPFRASGTSPDEPVRFEISGRDALRLARNPQLARFRYEGLP